MSPEPVSIIVLVTMFVIAVAAVVFDLDVDRDAFFRRLLAYGAVVVAVAPLLIWLTFVVPTAP